ncbi:MAG: hypothetical protein ACI3ZA_08095 [Alloprevotella sp.]
MRYFLENIFLLVGRINQMILIKTSKNILLRLKPLGYAAGLIAEPVSLIGSRSPLIPAAAVGARPLQTSQGKNHKKP